MHVCASARTISESLCNFERRQRCTQRYFRDSGRGAARPSWVVPGDRVGCWGLGVPTGGHLLRRLMPMSMSGGYYFDIPSERTNKEKGHKPKPSLSSKEWETELAKRALTTSSKPKPKPKNILKRNNKRKINEKNSLATSEWNGRR